MNELEQWFEDELGPLGLHLTPTIYDPFSFTPSKGVMYTYITDNGLSRTIKLRCKFTPVLYTSIEVLNNMKHLIIQEIEDELVREGVPRPYYYNPTINFTPIKRLRKFSL